MEWIIHRINIQLQYSHLQLPAKRPKRPTSRATSFVICRLPRLTKKTPLFVKFIFHMLNLLLRSGDQIAAYPEHGPWVVVACLELLIKTTIQPMLFLKKDGRIGMKHLSNQFYSCWMKFIPVYHVVWCFWFWFLYVFNEDFFRRLTKT